MEKNVRIHKDVQCTLKKGQTKALLLLRVLSLKHVISMLGAKCVKHSMYFIRMRDNFDGLSYETLNQGPMCQFNTPNISKKQGLLLKLKTLFILHFIPHTLTLLCGRWSYMYWQPLPTINKRMSSSQHI